MYRRACVVAIMVSVGSLAAQIPTYEVASSSASPRISSLRDQVLAGRLAATEGFWREIQRDGAPLMEPIPGDVNHSLVTFLWRATAEVHNVVIFDGVAGFDAKDQLMRLARSDVWYRTYRIRNDARFAYNLSPDDSLEPFDRIKDQDAMAKRLSMLQTDPLNPRRCPATFGALTAQASYVALPAAPPLPWNNAASGSAKGKLEATTFHSDILSNTRTLWIYTPAGFRLSARAYPLLVIFDGDRNAKWIPTILDNLIAQRKIPPMVAVLIDNPSAAARIMELPCYPPFADFLSEELVPWVRKTYKTSKDPSRNVAAGSSFGGLAAMFAGLGHSEVFGNVLSLSGSFWWKPEGEAQPDWLAKQFVTHPKLPLRFYLEAGLMEDLARQVLPNRSMRKALNGKGYIVGYSEYDGGHAFLNWSGGIANGLMFLVPFQADANERSALVR